MSDSTHATLRREGRPFRDGWSFDGLDVEMVGAGMVGIARQNRINDCHEFHAPSTGL